MDFDPRIKKRMRQMLLFVALLFGSIFLYKGLMGFMIKRALSSNQNPLISVSAMKVEYSYWQPQLRASGSLRAIRGVEVTTELAGLVEMIYFTPGAFVEQNTVLVQLNAKSDLALLHSLEANAELARVTFLRDQAQYAVKAVSKQTLDTDAANLKSLLAQVDQQTAIVAKKTIRAPFTGRLGINKINPGQYVNPGDSIVMLQTLDPIYADFFMPQQALATIQVGQAVTITSDTYPGKTFEGRITTINPAVDVSTRNVEVEATIDNPQYDLAPGMFTTVTIDTGELQRYLTLPQAAISFNPYGELVYVIKETAQEKEEKPNLTVTQAFIETGDSRGDQIAILHGLKEGDQVVTSGQLKLKNGSRVVINNTVVPANNPNPQVLDEH
ncbi:MAG TPA: efflux RND transporter periplasmic adaptor subunit [Gammaproteobacteria bacterium]|nr:efflux RND transporter periplasmic adaptor subunit [Gammaproteobacteria bacterium]